MFNLIDVYFINYSVKFVLKCDLCQQIINAVVARTVTTKNVFGSVVIQEMLVFVADDIQWSLKILYTSFRGQIEASWFAACTYIGNTCSLIYCMNVEYA